MLKRPYKDKKPDQEKTKHWLSWLAQRLVEENKTEFLIENIQPHLLRNKFQINIYNLIVMVIINTFLFGVISLSFSMVFSKVFWGGIWLIYGIIYFGFFALKDEEIITIEALSFSIKKSVFYGVIFGFVFGITFGSILGFINGLIYGFSYSLIVGAIYGIDGKEIKNKIYPNQGIRRSIINTIILSVMTCLFLTPVNVMAEIIFMPKKKYILYTPSNHILYTP